MTLSSLAHHMRANGWKYLMHHKKSNKNSKRELQDNFLRQFLKVLINSCRIITHKHFSYAFSHKLYILHTPQRFYQRFLKENLQFLGISCEFFFALLIIINLF